MAERSTKECLDILGLDPPKLGGKTQDEVDVKLAAWKSTSLKAAYKAKAKEVHPDANPDMTDAVFISVRESFEQLRGLKVSLKKPSVQTWTKCPTGHDRLPVDANYCYSCGFCFLEDALIARLKSQGLTETSVERMRDSGDLDRLRKMDPLSSELHSEISLMVYRQRHGLINRYSNF